MNAPKCPLCGRFSRWDATRGVWWCDFDERAALTPARSEYDGKPSTAVRELLRRSKG